MWGREGQEGRGARRGTPCHGGCDPFSASPALLLDEEDCWDGDSHEEAPAKLEGQVGSTATSQMDWKAGQGHGPGSVSLYLFFLLFFPSTLTHTYTHTRSHSHTHARTGTPQVGCFSAAARALFMAVESAAVWASVPEELCAKQGHIAGTGPMAFIWCCWGYSGGRVLSRACCTWAAFMWGEGLRTSQLWCLHGGFSLLVCLEGFPAQQDMFAWGPHTETP